MAVVVPLDRYEAMERARDRFRELVDKNWERNKDVPPEEIEEGIERAIRDVRAK